MARSTAGTSATATGKPQPKRRSNPRGQKSEPVVVTFGPEVAARLGKVETLPQFLASAGQLTREDRVIIVDQALVMIDQTYVHLPLKRAMHAVEPVQRLRLVKQRLDIYSERAFHDEMISIFVHLRDLHTNYILPNPYRSRVAFLPFRIEECFVPAGRNKESVREAIRAKLQARNRRDPLERHPNRKGGRDQRRAGSGQQPRRSALARS
jgi:hypothetical protein